MPILSNKSGITFSGKSYAVGDPIPFQIVKKQLRQLRAAGRVRVVDVSERRAYTSGQRFKRVAKPTDLVMLGEVLGQSEFVGDVTVTEE